MTKFKIVIARSAIATTGLPEIIPQAVPCIARAKQNETLIEKTKCAATTTCNLLKYQRERERSIVTAVHGEENFKTHHESTKKILHSALSTLAFTAKKSSTPHCIHSSTSAAPPLREPLTIAAHHRPGTSSQSHKTMLAGGTTGIEVALQNNDK
jgi:hypothetical protein